MLILTGELVNVNEREGYLTYRVPFTNWAMFVKRGFEIAQIGLVDGRSITAQQRKKAYALMGEISGYTGYHPDDIKLVMKRQFISQHMEALQKELFSLSDCDETTARDFITYLVDFIIEFDIPTETDLKNLCEDIEQYVYACLMHRKCAVCGKKTELHHVDAVGMGRNRREICHIGMRCLPLCADHHRLGKDAAHTIGDAALMEKYHLEAVVIDERIAKEYRLNAKGGRKPD